MLGLNIWSRTGRAYIRQCEIVLRVLKTLLMLPYQRWSWILAVLSLQRSNLVMKCKSSRARYGYRYQRGTDTMGRRRQATASRFRRLEMRLSDCLGQLNRRRAAIEVIFRTKLPASCFYQKSDSSEAENRIVEV